MAARRNKARKKDKRRRHAETRKKDAEKRAATTEGRTQQPARAAR
jgi:hypothetical protein